MNCYFDCASKDFALLSCRWLEFFTMPALVMQSISYWSGSFCYRERKYIYIYFDIYRFILPNWFMLRLVKHRHHWITCAFFLAGLLDTIEIKLVWTFVCFQKGLKIVHHADTTLNSFCTWQKNLNPQSDTHPAHHDVAILITR